MATAITSISITPDCKVLTATITDAVLADLYAIDNKVTGTSGNTDTIGTVTIDANDIATWVITSEEFGEDFNGVIEIAVEADDLYAYYVGSCEISCCISALVQQAIDCHCECDRCDEDLRVAEKVNLLIKSAQHVTHSDANISDAVAKYNKAKEFCTATCACGC